jgi:N-hydroxyarylamine O-acetyltransferase
MEAGPYLERIEYRGPLDPDAETLKQLHLAHMQAVPFENLDIPLGRPIELSVPAFYDKIVRRRRGGFCYELNGLFGWLLERLGFEVSVLSGRVFDGPRRGPEFDHMALLVEVEEPYIADVGFGDSFLEPLRLAAGIEEVQGENAYRLTGSDSEWVLEQRSEIEWEPQYTIALTARRLGDFEAMCAHHQTSPESTFTRKAVCSRVTTAGRITLANGRLIETVRGQRQERDVQGEAEYQALLWAHFGIDLGEGARVDRLMKPAGEYQGTASVRPPPTSA